ncbi:TRAP transporter substrate-binding protein (plasmid) [Photobacterium sp. GJ3]|uniref:TRAP transporter substrate-binding protein n=1 Tax=Photobacterium sp. GJ3 TaxID=2829502 RepID=UPI001B8D020F|nr:TRAP transporter substrate-binding protein [Photobacterium sp. GJ3]QUJ69691.1 TRAP transporter substrate-binding protein [Photobacterium sp. GJ3]
MKKILTSLALAISLAATPVWAETTLRVAHNAADGNPKAEASLLFAKLVEEKTDGRIKVEVGGNAQFGDDAEAITSMRLGAIAFSANSQGTTSSVVPEFALLGLPFLFSNQQDAWRVLDGTAGDKLSELAAQKGLVVLAYWDNGIRHVSNNVRPITKPSELAGIKLRTPPDTMTVDIFQTLGANPTPMAFSELYIALQQGVVDGQENPLANIYSSKLYEVQKYISFTGHKYEATPFLASKIVWDRLSQDDQAAIREAAKEAGDFNRKTFVEQETQLRAEMEAAGVMFNDVEHSAFVAATQPVYEKWKKDYPELVSLLVRESTQSQ